MQYILGGLRIQQRATYGVELSLLASIVLAGSSIPRAISTWPLSGIEEKLNTNSHRIWKTFANWAQSSGYIRPVDIWQCLSQSTSSID